MFRLNSQQFMGPLYSLQPPDLIHALNQVTQPKSRHLIYLGFILILFFKLYTVPSVLLPITVRFFTFLLSPPKTVWHQFAVCVTVHQ